jgi:membrane protein YqaA with SNARE-associated domain
MTLLLLLILLTSELPDPGRLAMVAYVSLLGGFVGSLIGRLCRRPRERVNEMAADGAFVGFGVAFIGWVVAVAIDRL